MADCQKSASGYQVDVHCRCDRGGSTWKGRLLNMRISIHPHPAIHPSILIIMPYDILSHILLCECCRMLPCSTAVHAQ